MSGDSVINLGELSKPATVLIEKISDAIGGVFKPYQILRIAKAQAEADRVNAEAQIEISDLQRRAFYRFLTEEANKQRNIEEIIQTALPQLAEESLPDKVEDDWITNFFDKCRLISDQQMQALWSRVLAGEANSPGKFSKRTISFLSGLDKSDADLFTTLCGFAWVIVDPGLPLIYDCNSEMYRANGVNFGMLTHLDSIGLIQFQPSLGFVRTRLPKRVAASYFGRALEIEMQKESENELEIGSVWMTKVGRELGSICGSQPVEGFYEYVYQKWKDKGYLGHARIEQAAQSEA